MRRSARLSTAIAVLLSAIVITGCASTTHLSYVQRGPRAPLADGLLPVVILSVDGSTQFNRRIALTPGTRVFVLQAVSADRIGLTQPVLAAMRIEPCTEYWFVARPLNPVDTDWELVIEAKEPVSGCDPDDAWKKAGRQPAPIPPSSSDVPAR